MDICKYLVKGQRVVYIGKPGTVIKTFDINGPTNMVSVKLDDAEEEILVYYILLSLLFTKTDRLSPEKIVPGTFIASKFDFLNSSPGQCVVATVRNGTFGLTIETGGSSFNIYPPCSTSTGLSLWTGFLGAKIEKKIPFKDLVILKPHKNPRNDNPKVN